MGRSTSHNSILGWQVSAVLLVFSLVSCTYILGGEAKAQVKNGGSGDYAMLAPKWPCSAARAADKQLSVLKKSVLWNTFGTDTKCLEEYLADRRLDLFELHLINEPCQRNNVCGDYEFLYGMSVPEYNSKLEQRDPALLAKLTKYFAEPAAFLKAKLQSHTKCYISPGLESNLSTAAATVLIEVTKKSFPTCAIVWNPVNGSKWATPIPGTVFEQHGSKPNVTPPCMVNLDGVDISFPTRPALLPNFIPSTQLPSYFSKYSGCEANFLWIAEDNGLTGQPGFVDPRARTNFPSASTFDLVVGALKDQQKDQ